MRDKNTPLGLYTIGIAALFLAGFLLLVILGARSYRDTVAVQRGNMETRALLSYLATTVKANDTAAAVSVERGESGDALILTDGERGYALRIYRYDGDLVEEYAAAGTPLSPEDAQVIAPTEVFRAEQTEDGLLRLTTDAGQVLLRLRSEGGGEA